MTDSKRKYKKSREILIKAEIPGNALMAFPGKA